MRRVIPRCAAAVTLLVLSAAPAAAQEPRGATESDLITVLGRVVDARTGTPLGGAVVRVVDSRLAVITDSTGNFALTGLSPGHVSLGFEQLGYANMFLTQEFAASSAPLRVEMEPQPVVLEGLKVMADRFKQRRLSTGVSVRLLDVDDFRASPPDLLDAVRLRGGLGLFSCTPRYSTTTWCVYSRGRRVAPSVVIDDRPSMGLEELELYRTDEVYAVEIYRGGQHIRVYTREYVSRTAISPRAVFPVDW